METNTTYPYNNKKDIKPNIFRACLDLLNNGYTESGKYETKPYLNATKTVYCDQDTEGGGWTVFLRNAYGLVTFNKTWIEYKNGFGNVEYDFWLGNEFMYNVTTLYNTHISKAVDLYVIVADEDDKSYSAIYKNFAILSENTSYTLQVSDCFNGTLRDVLYHHNNAKFSTKDKDMVGMVGGITIAIVQCLPIWYMTRLIGDTDQPHVGIIYIMITKKTQRMPQ